jgi:hypothetical protein
MIYICIITYNYLYFVITPVKNMTINQLVISIFIFLVLFITSTIVHEYSHYAVAKILNHKCKVHLFKKPYVEFFNDLPKKDFVLIAIAPLLIHLIQFILFMYLFPFNLVFGTLFLLQSVMGCMSDLYFISRILGYDGHSFVFRFKERGNFEVVPSYSII